MCEETRKHGFEWECQRATSGSTPNPVARAMAQICDRLITHPNVLNGAQLYWNLDNTYYVEGYGLDKFAAGSWGLEPVRQNKIGLLLDKGIEPDLLLRQIQAADATRATLGLNITDYVITDAPLEVEIRTAESGASWGTIGNTASLLRGAEKLIAQARAEAIAIVARFPDEIDSIAFDNYRQGSGVDPIAGAEAVISHLIVRQFKIPAAHAPALQALPVEVNVAPKAAAEELGYTFLPCILVGLARAPQFVTKYKAQSHLIWSEDIDALVIPASACGSSAALSLSNSRTTIITVAENITSMKVFPETLGMKTIAVNSYLEALGVLVTQRAGINLNSLSSSVSPLHHLS